MTFLSSIQENHGYKLYCVAFNHIGTQNQHIFATTGGSQATIYACLPSGKIEPLYIFQNEPGEYEEDDEDYYVCQWSIDTTTGNPLLLLAGKTGILKIIDCVRGLVTGALLGHGQSINDIAVHPTRPHIVATASKDTSVRVWNIATLTCCLMLEGDCGHGSEVLSIDWHPSGSMKLASAGMDNAVKIWDIGRHEEVIAMSERWEATKGGSFPSKKVAEPIFSTKHAHCNFVDCVRWLGEMLLTKSVDEQIMCWKPIIEGEKNGIHDENNNVVEGRLQSQQGRVALKQNEKIQFVQQLLLEGTRDVWWMKFNLDTLGRVLAQGTSEGSVMVFDPGAIHRDAVAVLTPKRIPLSSNSGGCGEDEDKDELLVRQTAVSYDGGIIIACHEGGSVTRFDRI